MWAFVATLGDRACILDYGILNCNNLGCNALNWSAINDNTLSCNILCLYWFNHYKSN
jgi:hypothetical protein